MQKEHVHRNARLAEVARGRYGFQETSPPVPFLCECGDPDCEAYVPLTLEQYEQARKNDAPLTAAEHTPLRRRRSKL